MVCRSTNGAAVIEALILMLATTWVTLLALKKDQENIVVDVLRVDQHRNLQVNTMSHALFNLYILGGIVVVFSLLYPKIRYKNVQLLCRHERDNGLIVGCLLPPLVLLSRLLVENYHESTESSLTFFYAWVTISNGFSALIKIALFKSVTSFRVSAIVDAILLPMLFGVLNPVESAWRFLLATGVRSVVAVVLAAGLQLLPRSFTIGEAILVAQGIGLGVIDSVLVTMTRLNELDVISIPPQVFHSWRITSVNRPDYVLALEIGMLGSLLVCVGLIPLFQAHGASSPTRIAQPLPLRESMLAGLITAVVGGGVVYLWSGFLLQTRNPFLWLIKFLTETSSSSWLPLRIMLMIYWVTLLTVLIPIITIISNRFKLRKIVARKLFHFLIVLMLGPASLIDVPMLSLSYGVALSVFILMECARALSLPPFGHFIAEFMRSFIDFRESGRVILTHSYLLLGCALPLWLVPASDAPSPLIMNAGILALGIADAMGALVGSSVGKYKLFGSKTVEGSLAVFLSMLFASVLLQNYHLRLLINQEYTQMLWLTLAVFLTTVLEAATAQIDNLVLPLFFFAVCNLVECHRLQLK